MHNNISGFEIKLCIFYVWIHTSFWDYFQNCLWEMEITYVDHLLLKQSFLYFIKFHSTAASFHASFQNLIDFSIFTFHVCFLFLFFHCSEAFLKFHTIFKEILNWSNRKLSVFYSTFYLICFDVYTILDYC